MAFFTLAWILEDPGIPATVRASVTTTRVSRFGSRRTQWARHSVSKLSLSFITTAFRLPNSTLQSPTSNFRSRASLRSCLRSSSSTGQLSRGTCIPFSAASANDCLRSFRFPNTAPMDKEPSVIGAKRMIWSSTSPWPPCCLSASRRSRASWDAVRGAASASSTGVFIDHPRRFPEEW